MSLSDGAHENVLLDRLIAGIPIRLRDQAELVTGSFDVVVTKVNRVLRAQVQSEQIREVVDRVRQNSRPTDGNCCKTLSVPFL